MASKLGRNDPCFCGSGRKYKKCHLNRQSESPLPPPAIESAARPIWNKKTCLHPQAGPDQCGKIIQAHTIQRGRILSQIIDERNQVLTFYRVRQDEAGQPQPRSVGWRDASTFSGFCDVHDSIFQPVENCSFESSPQQRFLLAYRAICHEVYQKRRSMEAQALYRDLADRGMSRAEQYRTQRMWRSFAEGVASGLEWAESIKSEMDGALLRGDFERFSWFVVDCDGPVSVASLGVVSSDVDILGNEVQNLKDLNWRVQPLFFSVAARDTGCSLVFGWRRGDTAPEKVVRSFEDCLRLYLPSMILQYAFAYIENTFFSREWWGALNAESSKVIRSHAMNGVPYAFRPAFVQRELVPWRVQSVSRM